MLAHYIKTIVRQLFRYKFFSFITITGLAIGIACTVLISLYVYDEYSFDRFHSNANHIYRLTQEFKAPGEQSHVPYAGPLVGPALVHEFPGIEQVTQLGITAPVMLGFNETYVVPEGSETYYATPTFFEVFTFPLSSGNPATALSNPYSIVITESLAKKLLGDTEPVGQFLYFNVHGQERQALQITGILQKIPSKSHLQFEALVSFSTLEDINRNNPGWSNQFVSTYLLLRDGQQVSSIEDKLHDFLVKHEGSTKASTRSFFLQPLPEIHLRSNHLNSDRAIRGDLQLVILLLGIAVGIILMASINFMNLATARSVHRAREIGVRKSFGAQRKQLMKQFLSESIAFALLALVIGLFLVEILLPTYNTFVDKALHIPYKEAWYLFIGFAVLTGLFSGIYPALFLSLFQPVNVLKGKPGAGIRNHGLRKVLVVFQFSIAILLFISTGIVFQQLDYIQKKDLGFENERVLYTVIPSGTPWENELFKQELLQHSNISSVGRAVVRPLYSVASDFPNTPTLAEINGKMIQTETALRWLEVGYGFLETFEMQLLAGRTFSEDRATDATEAFILNETAIAEIGWSSPQEAIGKAFEYDGQKGHVIGVLKDFNFESLHSSILPFVVRYNRFSPMVFVKIGPENIQNTVTYVQQTWEKHSTSKEPFNYQFMDEIYSQYYTSEKNLQTILFAFASLAVFITCLGVIGLTVFTVEQKKKEIGIRKVLGASSKNVVGLISRETLLLFTIANMVAWPLAYYGMNTWLKNFAYQVNLGIYSFLLGAFLVGFITFLILGFQSLKAAQTNPIDTLRYS
ncbi:MAG: ABC transporter permease [Balneolales bacterium]|nr:ABC transporter permease [Balneolales bacterium]